jgi:hypothetical protein
MYDSGKVITGLVVFIVLMASPFWLNFGKTGEAPKLQKVGVETKCVEQPDWMKANHMQLLNDWRTEVVRDNERNYVNKEDVEHKKSLTMTCLKCHKEKKKFCDKCHTYASVKPFCWTCHVDPKEEVL